MSVTDLLPQLHELTRAEKIYFMQYLVSSLAQEEKNLLQSNISYPVWSPYDAFEAAETMLAELQKAQADAHA